MWHVKGCGLTGHRLDLAIGMGLLLIIRALCWLILSFFLFSFLLLLLLLSSVLTVELSPWQKKKHGLFLLRLM